MLVVIDIESNHEIVGFVVFADQVLKEIHIQSH